MKKVILFIAAVLFSTLFYEKNIGLNLCLFGVLTVIILFINNKNDFKTKDAIIYTALYLGTGIAVFFHDSSLAIMANLVAFFTLIGKLSQNKTSIYVNWLNGLYTAIAGWFHRNFAINETTQSVEPKTDIDYLHIACIVLKKPSISNSMMRERRKNLESYLVECCVTLDGLASDGVI